MSHLFLPFKVRNELSARLFRLFFKRYFKHFGYNARILAPSGIEGIGNISIGNGVYIAQHVVLAAVGLTDGKDCILEIGDGTHIGRFNHIYATGHIRIGKHVLTANNVYISDNAHSYDAPEKPILDQPVLHKSDVEIGDGSWLGHNVCVIGARIGRNCVIGANAVVTGDIPDYSVAVGAPARVIKRYDSVARLWRRTDAQGRFMP